MIVVSDTSPINYLILIGHENLLFELYGQVVIPQTVFDELGGRGAPPALLDWLDSVPEWIEVKQPHLVAPSSLDALHRGEKDAILLAQELSADLLLLDDRQARIAAAGLGIAITGTIGILDKAAREGLVDLETVLTRLQTTNFYIAGELIEKLLTDHLRER